MKETEAEIVLHNGFPNHSGEGDLLVGIISKGEVREGAVLEIYDCEIKMYKIQIHEDIEYECIRIEFEVDRKLEPPVYWWKLYKSRIKVKNRTYTKT